MEVDYRQKTMLNRECRFMMKSIGSECEIQNIFILTTNSETGDNKQDEWQGFVVAIKNKLKSSNASTTQKLKDLNDKMDEMETDLSHEIQEMVENAKEDIQSQISKISHKMNRLSKSTFYKQFK